MVDMVLQVTRCKGKRMNKQPIKVTVKNIVSLEVNNQDEVCLTTDKGEVVVTDLDFARREMNLRVDHIPKSVKVDMKGQYIQGPNQTAYWSTSETIKTETV